MKDYSNLAPWDQALRILIGLAMLLLGWSHAVDGFWGVALVTFAWVPLLTGILGWSPFYALMGISSRKLR